jgi:type I restriction enzyme R subunit
VTEANINEFGRFDELILTVDNDKARAFFIVVEKQKYRDYRLKMLVDRYLRAFILSGGIDPYPDVADAQEHKSSKQQDQAQKESDNSEESVYSVSTTVKAKKVGQWYSSSNAVACLMDTGCFACVEDKVCLNDKKYVGRDQDTGNMRLTTYAKAHEEECFLQFVTDNDGNLHYVKLPAAIADKEFKYSDHISDDILKQYGLVNEMSDQMLTAIEKMEFGPALKELMSKRICDYSVRLLHDITGLDTATINNMRKSQNMTQLNVVSACLGIHLPYPVSTAMLELANIIFSMSRGPESNKTYIQLLSTRWASDYEDIYDDLKEQGLQDLIKQPPI